MSERCWKTKSELLKWTQKTPCQKVLLVRRLKRRSSSGEDAIRNLANNLYNVIAFHWKEKLQIFSRIKRTEDKMSILIISSTTPS